jgi:hypothetical protein
MEILSEIFHKSLVNEIVKFLSLEDVIMAKLDEEFEHRSENGEYSASIFILIPEYGTARMFDYCYKKIVPRAKYDVYLIIAAECGNFDVVKYICEERGYLRNHTQLALKAAIENHHYEIANFLEDFIYNLECIPPNFFGDKYEC